MAFSRFSPPRRRPARALPTVERLESRETPDGSLGRSLGLRPLADMPPSPTGARSYLQPAPSHAFEADLGRVRSVLKAAPAEGAALDQWLTVWLYEETKHPSAILKWLDAFGEKFDSDFMLQGRQTFPFMPSKMGTLATNVISEMVASTIYVTLSSQPTVEPVFCEICRSIGGDEARHAASFYSYGKRRIDRSEDPNQERADALRILYFWITPELNGRVGHPVNLLANRYQTNPLLQEAVPAEQMRSAIESTYKRACRVFESLLGVELRDASDVSDQLNALQND